MVEGDGSGAAGEEKDEDGRPRKVLGPRIRVDEALDDRDHREPLNIARHSIACRARSLRRLLWRGAQIRPAHVLPAVLQGSITRARASIRSIRATTRQSISWGLIYASPQNP